MKEIETQYVGSASINNSSFNTNIKPKEINYRENLIEIVEILKNEDYIKTHIDLYCVVGYANRFYSQNSKATKIDFFNELRDPKVLRIYKWEGKEEDFKYIMDCLNDSQHKKELGAFYTPKEYVKLSTKLVREAIKRIKQTGNDYIILDRCAGTGNLEQFLTDKEVKDITIAELDKYLDEETKKEYLQDKKDAITLIGKNLYSISMEELERYKTSKSIYDYIFDNELSHCVVNTYELKEWVVLNVLIGDKVKMIIPPVENVKQNEALVSGGDALSEYFIKGECNLDSIQNEENKRKYSNCIKELNEYIENPNINVIMLENPPYQDSSSDSIKGFDEKIRNNRKLNFICNEMKIKFKNRNKNTKSTREISNQFIWSAFEYYLKKENDFYILYSPVKYFKSIDLVNKTFIDGYLLNRQYFHASPSAISLILWQNINKQQENFELKIYDISQNKELYFIKNIYINKCNKNFTILYDKRNFDDDIETNVWCGTDGLERKKVDRKGQKSIFNKNIIGYLRSINFAIAPLNNYLVRQQFYIDDGFYLRSDNYITKLPLFCAKLYPQENWYERDVYFTTADKGEEYLKDKDFLKSCLIYTCLCRQNKCISFNGSDGRFYKNELCFNQNTIADKDLKKFDLNKDELRLFEIWDNLLKEAKNIKNYNEKFTYGLYQIDVELNICFKYDKNGNKIFSNDENYRKIKEKISYEYTELNTEIVLLKDELKMYYRKYIQEKLFKYDLLK